MGDARRPQREFPAADEGLLNREGEEEIGFSDSVVVEEIIGSGAEGVGVERPSAEGYGDAELMLFVAFAVQRDEGATVLCAQLHQWSGGGEQGWRLIVVAVESAEGPAQPWDGNDGADARADRVLGDASGKAGRAEAGGQSEPGERLELVV